MSVLEDAVKTLADALDRLEATLDDRMTQATIDSDAATAARRQAHTAKQHLNEVAEGLSSSMKELRGIIANQSPKDES